MKATVKARKPQSVPEFIKGLIDLKIYTVFVDLEYEHFTRQTDPVSKYACRKVVYHTTNISDLKKDLKREVDGHDHAGVIIEYEDGTQWSYGLDLTDEDLNICEKFNAK